MEKEQKSKFENSIELLKVIIWPLILLLVLIMYHEDVKKIINNSTKVSIGTFSMEVMREAEVQGFPQLGKLVNSLNEKEIKSILSLSKGIHSSVFGRSKAGFTLSEEFMVWDELQKIGLIEFENFTTDEIFKIIEDLNAEKITVYYDKNMGQSSYEGSDVFINESYIWEINSDQLSPEEIEKLKSYTFSLSEKGEQTIHIIVESLVKELNK
jgi:hypothetical protein